MADLEFDSYEYWYEHPELFQGGSNYKSDLVWEGFAIHLTVPEHGYCIQIGVNTGVTFNKMKQKFGLHRTRGIDLYNYNNDSNVYELNINEIDFDIPIAYCENDVGIMAVQPQTRLNAMKWAIKNLVPGGKMLTTSNVANEAFGERVEDICEANGCTWERLDDYNDQPWARYINEETLWNTISLMLVTKSI